MHFLSKSNKKGFINSVNCEILDDYFCQYNKNSSYTECNSRLNFICTKIEFKNKIIFFPCILLDMCGSVHSIAVIGAESEISILGSNSAQVCCTVTFTQLPLLKDMNPDLLSLAIG